jgi:hypothetical protein
MVWAGHCLSWPAMGWTLVLLFVGWADHVLVWPWAVHGLV